MADNKPADRPMNDRSEGIMRDPVNWQGQIVSYVKDIGNGDPGYNANLRQVLIMKQDGTEQVVPETEILRDVQPVVQQSSEPDRRPDQTLPPALPTGDNPQARDAVDDGKAPAARATAERPAPEPFRGPSDRPLPPRK